ncbi:MAG: flagellar export chaperone FliS [Porticoccaceae bacterium]|jgi:flagellar protein FliS
MALNQRAVEEYRGVQVTSAVSYANGIQLIQMLFNGLLDALTDAERHIQSGDIGKKSDAISRATKIIVALKGSLDFEKGGELARNLDDLYDYATRQLLKANLHNQDTLVHEIKSLMAEINSGWELLPSLVKNQNAAMLS